MGIQNGSAPESGAIDWMTKFTMERDSLQVQLQESERLRTEAFQSCETMRRERDDRTAQLQSAIQQAMELRQQAEALEASLDQEQGVSKTLQQQLADADAQIRQFERINDTRDELEHKNKELQAQLDAAKNEASKTGWVLVGSHLPNREQLNTEIVRLQNNLTREADERKALQQQRDELQAQLEAAAVTPAQQPDGNAAERLEAVRRVIGEIWGWYACVECLGEQSAETWEQVGALLGHLQREAD